MTAYNKEKKRKTSANSLPLFQEPNLFYSELNSRDISLSRLSPSVLQINVGKLCNLTCEHCHVEAGPKRKEIMTWETAEQCLFAAKELGVSTIDLTGGAPEMVPNFREILKQATSIAEEVIIRSNLTILVEPTYTDLPELFSKHGVRIVASLPCYSEENVDQQRGDGVFEASIEALKILNHFGYGQKHLTLDLVYNPLGPNLPPPQGELEKDYKNLLSEKFDICFSSLLTITNMPIGRFYSHLKKQKEADSYISLLRENFNPETVEHLMCRNTLNVSWDGWIYDCDFNQMLEMPVMESQNPVHISEIERVKKLTESRIKTATHCLGCTAGSGSSCGGVLS